MAGPLSKRAIDVLGRSPIGGDFVRRRGWYPYRHHLVLLFGARENVTYTQFVRLPRQYEALAGPVVDFVAPERRREPLKILVFGCSNGAEPYSIASMLALRRPGLDFHITATDLEPEMVAKAESARYTRKDVTMNGVLDPEFLDRTFIERGDIFEVRPEIAARTTFRVADVLDERQVTAFGTADIVVAQNFLYHLRRPQARTAFKHLCERLGPRSALMIDGMDIDLRERLTRKAGLVPLDHLIPEIHDDALKLRGPPWPWIYWSLEPLDTRRPGWKQRYATIYLRDRPA